MASIQLVRQDYDGVETLSDEIEQPHYEPALTIGRNGNLQPRLFFMRQPCTLVCSAKWPVRVVRPIPVEIYHRYRL
jgi:hypothetical protein